MSEPALTIEPDTTVRVAATRMWANQVGSVLVTEDDELVGIVTERDLTWVLAEGREAETAVSEVMSKPVVSIEPAANVENAIEVMEEEGVRRLAVVLEGDLRGVVSVTDIAYAEADLARRARENLSRKWED